MSQASWRLFPSNLRCERRGATLQTTVVALICAASSPTFTAETVLVQGGSSMRYLAPSTNALGTTWTAPGFADAGWTAGTYGVGYDSGAMIHTTVAATVDAVYTRAHFTVADLAAVESVWLGADYDDGFVAWINGVEVARVNLPAGAPTNTTLASSSHESSNGATPTYDPVRNVTAKALPALVQGDNVLAIGVWNNSGTSTDLALVPLLSVNRPVLPPGEVHWTLAQSPVNVDSTLTIPLNTILRIDAGVTVRVAAGVTISVNGQIEANGTEAEPIVFDRQGATGSWGGIEIHQDEDGIPRASSLRHARLLHGETLIDVDGTGDSEIVI